MFIDLHQYQRHRPFFRLSPTWYAGALVLSVDAHTWLPLPATLNLSESREAAAREGSTGCSPCEPGPRAVRVTHGMACATRWLVTPGAAPLQSGRHAGVLMVRAPLACARVVLPRRTGVASRTDVTQRYNAGNPRSSPSVKAVSGSVGGSRNSIYVTEKCSLF